MGPRAGPPTTEGGLRGEPQGDVQDGRAVREPPGMDEGVRRGRTQRIGLDPRVDRVDKDAHPAGLLSADGRDEFVSRVPFVQGRPVSVRGARGSISASHDGGVRPRMSAGHGRRTHPAHEIAEVFRIPDEDARHRLERLAAAGLLTARTFDGITAWRWADKKMEKLPMELVKVSHVPPEVQVEAVSDLKPIVTKAVQSLYTEVATRPDKAYHFPLGLEALRYLGYPEEDLRKLPPTATESFAGVGYPHAANVMQTGDTVLDIGSGSGTDVLYTALKVGPKGAGYGLEITPAMIAKARTNIAETGARNVEVLEGGATKIPLPDRSVDVVTSNGVLNLVPDKPAAFQEIFRVLRRGGHLQLADIVVEEDVGAVCGLNPQLWADCIGGAAVEMEYLATIQDAGVRDVRILPKVDYFAKSSSESTKRITKSFGAKSVVVAAAKQ